MRFQTRITHRHLPHIDSPGSIFFITYRLAGSIPKHVADDFIRKVADWKSSRSNLPDIDTIASKRLFALFDKYLDDCSNGHAGPLHLKNPDAAAIVMHHLNWGIDNQRYLLHRYCVMPNHVHLLIEPQPVELPFVDVSLSWSGYSIRREKLRQAFNETEYFKLSQIMQGLKGVSARDVNRKFELSGSLWQDESFDHVVRDAVEYERIINYIDRNPVAAKLCTTPESWRYSSAGQK